MNYKEGMGQTLTSDNIKEYLENNPNFFEKNPDTLSNLMIPHPTGGAISLVERQVLMLREENQKLLNCIKRLQITAENNVGLFEKTSRLLASLVIAGDLKSLINTLSDRLNNDFKIEFHRLIMFDKYKFEPNIHTKVSSIDKAKQNISSIMMADGPCSGISIKAELDFLFDSDGQKVKSAAASKLFNNSIFGILAIGNSDESYYNSEMDTIFFSHITKLLNALIPLMMTRL
ncbi:MAG: hypothetical protein CMK44_04240 [Porticoccus sp.]|jgi:uncharacterized protein YigA (DUF484 family)|nr:hypothetical protein [Porticoccus sp.]|tara:strand:- start:378 stop:1070 length:693 start_codon:yes stop_codon:yes gene_type:complete